MLKVTRMIILLRPTPCDRSCFSWGTATLSFVDYYFPFLPKKRDELAILIELAELIHEVVNQNYYSELFSKAMGVSCRSGRRSDL